MVVTLRKPLREVKNLWSVAVPGQWGKKMQEGWKTGRQRQDFVNSIPGCIRELFANFGEIPIPYLNPGKVEAVNCLLPGELKCNSRKCAM